MKSKLKIESITLQSFVTKVDHHSLEKVEGGTGVIVDPGTDSGRICPSCPIHDCPSSNYC